VASSKQVDAQLQQVAWTMASRMNTGVIPAEPWEERDARQVERRAGCLALLRVYTQMIKVLQRRVDLTVKEALSTGATYGDIGTACRISRQAARQRWERHRDLYEFPKVRLTGGPRDGEWERPQPGESFTVELWKEGPARPSGFATYGPSPDDPKQYIYMDSQSYDWDAVASRGPGGPRPGGFYRNPVRD
jgi:hypothetical protein